MSDGGQAHSGTRGAISGARRRARIRHMHPSRSGAAEPAELDREFNSASLAGLREAVLAFAAARGMSRGRATDVMLAVHELAANAVRHGPGHGRLRMRVTARTLRCEVSDPGQACAWAWQAKE